MLGERLSGAYVRDLISLRFLYFSVRCIYFLCICRLYKRKRHIFNRVVPSVPPSVMVVADGARA